MSNKTEPFPHLCLSGLHWHVALRFSQRLLGLSYYRVEQTKQLALLFPNCQWVHSFGLRHRFFLVLLSADWHIIKSRVVEPNQVHGDSQASHALELPFRFQLLPPVELQKQVHEKCRGWRFH